MWRVSLDFYSPFPGFVPFRIPVENHQDRHAVRSDDREDPEHPRGQVKPLPHLLGSDERLQEARTEQKEV